MTPNDKPDWLLRLQLEDSKTARRSIEFVLR